MEDIAHKIFLSLLIIRDFSNIYAAQNSRRRPWRLKRCQTLREKRKIIEREVEGDEGQGKLVVYF